MVQDEAVGAAVGAEAVVKQFTSFSKSSSASSVVVGRRVRRGHERARRHCPDPKVLRGDYEMDGGGGCGGDGPVIPMSDL